MALSMASYATNRLQDGEVSKLNADENIATLEDDDKVLLVQSSESCTDKCQESLTFLDGLVATPYPDDVIHFAIPVCAPYGAMSTFKYRLKLIPGTGKRGKGRMTRSRVCYLTAISQLGKWPCMHFCTKTMPVRAKRTCSNASRFATDNSRVYADAVQDEELVRSMPSKVKVMTSVSSAGKKK